MRKAALDERDVGLVEFPLQTPSPSRGNTQN
jgi:hypothetical protein